MVQDAAKTAGGSDDEPLRGHRTQQAELLVEPDDMGSIDQLLAATDVGWDVEAQVLTLQQAAATTRHSIESASSVVASPPVRATKGPPPLPRKGPPRLPAVAGRAPAPTPIPVRVLSDVQHQDAIIDVLQSRVPSLEQRQDKVGLARVQMELAIVSETVLGDDARAKAHAEAALRANPSATAAHRLLRGAKHSRSNLPALLEHLEQELTAASTDARRVELLVERARLLEALGGRSREARASWEQALAHDPDNAAALKGLESELVVRALSSGAAADWEALAVHLERLAQAYASETALAAWLHVERARLLERKLDQPDAARAALERGLELDPGVGPVRDAMVRHVGTYGDWSTLARLLDEEALIDRNEGRAARFELDAAAIVAFRLADRKRACALLERAAARAPTAASVDRRVLDELVRLHEIDGRSADAARARRARLRFTSDPAILAHELRALAAAAEQQGDPEAAVGYVQRALALDAADPTLLEWLDRLLAACGKHEARIATFLQESARVEETERRAHALVRAAQICEQLGRHDDALRHLRSAWVALPGDTEILDGLARLLAPKPSEALDAGVRSLVELYGQAAEQTPDVGRKIAYLERVALLWEEVLGDPARAARTYEQILAIESDRRTAIVGLERTAARAGDARTFAAALLEEARVTVDREAQLALRVRAARVLSSADPARAIALVRSVLDQDAGHAAARGLETRLYEDAGRWELAAKSMRARIDLAQAPAQKVALWMALSATQNIRLRAPAEALASLERARAMDPSHPVLPLEAARLLEDQGDARALRDAVERLAAAAQKPEERARQLARAAEIDELRLGDDTSAARTYQRALAETPEDDLLFSRLARVMSRRARHRAAGELAELAGMLGRRIERASSPDAARAMSFELASLLVESGQEPMRATSLLEGVLADQGDHIPALRTLEWLRRRAAVDAGSLSRVLGRQADAFTDRCARLGALWNVAALEEWSLPTGHSAATYRAILELDPTDPGALEGILRCERSKARSGDPIARSAVLSALRTLASFAPNDDTRLPILLRLGLLLESVANDPPDPALEGALWREALERYREALQIDDLSLIASTGLARIASRLGDAESALAATESLAQLADDPRVRARHLLDAAEVLLGPGEDPRLGTPAERRERAASILERALEADSDSIPAAGRLATVLLEERKGERLVSAFRAALAKARSADSIVMLGSEVARVARDELHDLPVAIDAMRHVRASVPQHVPSLLTLAELCIAQRVWPEAVLALESVVTASRDPAPKLTALFALASIYEKVLAKPADVDRVLRAALSIDPRNGRALRALVRRLSAESTPVDEGTARGRRREIVDLLDRLAEIEIDPERKTSVLVELSEVAVRLGDARAAERALVEAVATSPGNARAFARLAGIFRRADGVDSVRYAAALKALVGLGERLGRTDARWFAALGHLEIEALSHESHLQDGIDHLRRAVELDPNLYEARVELAGALSSSHQSDEACRVLMAMIAPSAQPLLSVLEPAAALGTLEEALLAERKTAEAVVISELRSFAGDLDSARNAWLRSRRLSPPDPQSGVVDRPTLVTQVLPPTARHVLLEVAAAIAGAESKMLRSDLSEIGLSPRDRIAARTGHPTRALLDRVARELCAGDVELVATPNVTRVRVLTHDAPWVCVPSTFVDLPEPVQLVGLARAVARIAYGVPWLDELAPAHIEALLVAAARQVAPRYPGQDSKTIAHYEASLARALSRRQRKLLDDLIPHLTSPQSRPPGSAEFVEALTRGEVRAAFLVGGDVLSLVDSLAPGEPTLAEAIEVPGASALTAVLGHPLVGDAVRFALTPEATLLRRRLGSTWDALAVAKGKVANRHG